MIGKRIRYRREELHMTQQELADRLGYKAKSSIAHIERGENDIPVAKVKLFAAALHTTVEYLMGWEDDDEQRALFELIKKLDRADRARLKERLETMLEAEKYL